MGPRGEDSHIPFIMEGPILYQSEFLSGWLGRPKFEMPQNKGYVDLREAQMKVSCDTPSSELLLFASSGSKPFSDAIEVVEVDGGRAHPLLTPEPRRSYMFASGKSLHDPLVIRIH